MISGDIIDAVPGRVPLRTRPDRARRMKRLSRTCDDGGSVVVEAVFVIPAAMMIILFAVQACLWAHASAVVQSAAAEGEQAATVLGGTPDQGVSRAEAVLQSEAASAVVDPSVQVKVLSDGNVDVTVAGRASSILPFLHLPVSAQRRASVSEFRSNG